MLAQAIGRLGNYFNQELYGRETTVPWGMEIFYRRDSSGMVDVHSLDGVSTGQVAAVVHPTFLYELLWNLLVFVLLIWADRRFRLGHGRLFALYVAAYCVGRFWVELLRDDTATHIAGIRINCSPSMFVFIGAVVYILLAPKGREDPATLRGTHAGTGPRKSHRSRSWPRSWWPPPRAAESWPPRGWRASTKTKTPRRSVMWSPSMAEPERAEPEPEAEADAEAEPEPEAEPEAEAEPEPEAEHEAEAEPEAEAEAEAEPAQAEPEVEPAADARGRGRG